MTVRVDIDNFEKEVIESSSHQLVILDISAEWCGPCRVLEPILDRLSAEYNDVFTLAKIEAEDENMKIAGRYGAKGFPTVIAIKDGEEVDRFHGAKSESFVREFIERNL
ncbi:MAG: thioredoxin [Thiotrichales bacterium]|jgi:putative thioredoxin|nr:thioredoxin [Thiotrichales bacterium]MBT3612736.1 thioredoxin [Thiotrichales bacterium]MBT3752899.1 thioredoxin [Thiotrichales bacterium]MBT3838001.1 thioredoxin [Thiotrichales bacterium]MBT4152758.1 thioredoxin [Thiotrichales bacterium]